MIDKKAIKNAIQNKIIRFEVDPNMGNGTVAFIGDSWFYFGGHEAEDMSPEEYTKNVPVDDIVDEIYDTLESFNGNADYQDEYDYYIYMIIFGN